MKEKSRIASFGDVLVERFIRELDNMKLSDWIDSAPYLAVAYLGYQFRENFQDSALCMVGLKLASGGSEFASTAGLGILAGYGVVAGVASLAEWTGATQTKLITDFSKGEDIPEPVLLPDEVVKHPGSRYCVGCPLKDWMECSPYLSALMNDYKIHYKAVHVVATGD